MLSSRQKVRLRSIDHKPLLGATPSNPTLSPRTWTGCTPYVKWISSGLFYHLGSSFPMTRSKGSNNQSELALVAVTDSPAGRIEREHRPLIRKSAAAPKFVRNSPERIWTGRSRYSKVSCLPFSFLQFRSSSVPSLLDACVGFHSKWQCLKQWSVAGRTRDLW